VGDALLPTSVNHNIQYNIIHVLCPPTRIKRKNERGTAERRCGGAISMDSKRWLEGAFTSGV
jgi:hypothetical protein